MCTSPSTTRWVRRLRPPDGVMHPLQMLAYGCLQLVTAIVRVWNLGSPDAPERFTSAYNFHPVWCPTFVSNLTPCWTGGLERSQRSGAASVSVAEEIGKICPQTRPRLVALEPRSVNR